MQLRSLSFNQAAEAVFAVSTVREGTLTDYRRLVKILHQSIGSRPVGAITRRDIQEAVAFILREKGLSPKSARNAVQVARMVLREAGSTAADGIRVPVPDPDVRPMTLAESKAFQAHLAPSAYRCHGVLLVLLATGLRLGEALALRQEDWDPAARQLHVTRSLTGPTKSGRVRSVDVPHWVSALRLPLEGSHSAVQRAMAGVCNAAGLRRFRVHDLRHTRATQLLLAGAPPLYVSQQLGHSSPGYTLQVYGHLAAATPAERQTWANLA
jgi:integrase